ncbi:hypothetical protein Lal_00035242 [Lupinus albus]|nr:hypothetical protein Lal_00035242 [Lupinus albus]
MRSDWRGGFLWCFHFWVLGGFERIDEKKRGSEKSREKLGEKTRENAKTKMIRFSGILLRFSSPLTTIRSGSSAEPCISCGDSRTRVTRISEENDEALILDYV